MRGRPRLDPDHVLSNAERVRRFRAKHGKPPAPKPPQPESPFPELKTFAELAEQSLEHPHFNPAALIG
jgi:hypothetical protein